MSYVASTFLGSYVPTSKTVRIINSVGQVVFTINSCNYQKSSVNGNNLNIVLEDSVAEYVLDFSSNVEAKQAMVNFKVAIDTLRLNCIQTSGGGSGPTINPIPISYAQYKTLQQANNLVPFQWYDVTDTGGVILPSGSTIRLQSVSTNDFHPEGWVLNVSRPKVSIDTITDDVLYYEKPDNKIVLINAKPLQQTIDSSCNNIVVRNKSSLTALTSNTIEVDGGSTASITGSNNVKISNCTNVTVINASNVVIDGIAQNLSALGFNLSDVTINTYDSIGKRGRANLTANKTLEAYSDVVEQVFSITSNNNIFTVLLENKIPAANSDFRIKYFTTSNTGNTIAIRNIDNSLIFTITDNEIGDWITFRWNKTTSLYEFASIEYGAGLSGIPYLVSPVGNNQTSFPLPIPAAVVTKMEMYVNGQKLIYGLDFSYSSSTQSVIYTNRLFNINNIDEIEFIIF